LGEKVQNFLPIGQTTAILRYIISISSLPEPDPHGKRGYPLPGAGRRVDLWQLVISPA